MSFPIAHTVEQATSMFDQTNCIQVAQGLPTSLLEQSLAQIRQIYDFLAKLPEDHQPDGYRTHHVIEPESLDPAIFGDTGDSIVAFAESLVMQHMPGQILRNVLAGDIEALRSAVRIRHHQGATSRNTYVPWHQDLAFLGTDEPWITCWIPFTPCGIDNPALDFIPRITTIGFAASLEGDDGGYGMGGILDQELDKYFGANAIWTPNLIPGDCMLFESSCVHRTSLHSQETSERLSLEIRFRRKPN